METLIYGRAFIGISLAFHIAIALFGVGIPLLISLAELVGIVKKDPDFTHMARRWTFSMATLFVAGALSGTVVAVTFGVLLSPFMAIASKVIMLPFFLETFAFFIETIFLGIYVFTWDRLSPWLHWLTSLPVVIAAGASAFLITTVNSFMSAPQGFTWLNGTVMNANQWVAMWNAAVPTRTAHSMLSYYATTAFTFAAMAALYFIRKHRHTPARHAYYEKMLGFTLLLGLIFSIGVGATGDQASRFIAQHEPEKFAAAEGVLRTGPNAPLSLGGYFDENHELRGSLDIPGGLSILLGGSKDYVIRGLEAFDPATWPPLRVHYFFNIMAVIGGLLVATPALYFLLRKFKRAWAGSKAMHLLTILTGIGSLLAVEFGWMLTEIGRQPWTIRGILLTKDAFTPSPAVLAYAFVFPLFYIILAAVTLWIIIGHYKNNDEH